MTEQEAKTKWCPFARTVWGDGSDSTGAAFNRWTDGDPDEPEHAITKCIGSACMAWRTIPASSSVPQEGFCGLAGKP